MKHVSILVLETAIPAAIVDPRYMFTAINDFLRMAELQPAFDVQFVGLNKEVYLQDGLISIHTNATLKDIKKTDLILIPALSGNMRDAIDKNADYLPWIVDQYKKGAEVASLCVGSFLLASTGLLKNKTCSTHWLFANEFRNMFPDVILTDDKVITEQNGIYSSGGATS